MLHDADGEMKLILLGNAPLNYSSSDTGSRQYKISDADALLGQLLDCLDIS